MTPGRTVAAILRLLLVALVLLPGAGAVQAKGDVDCTPFGLGQDPPQPLQPVSLPPASKCNTRTSHGLPLPDPKCTPGAVDPDLTLETLQTPGFTTKCVRDTATSAHDKAQTYTWYDIPHPDSNSGAAQVCEIDHLISLELGGADTLDNLWPQCGPYDVARRYRYFVMKDLVENYLARQVKQGIIDLSQAQKGIADDWTQYLDGAIEECGAKCTDYRNMLGN